MSRAKSRQNIDVCADCGALEATWTALNRGILLCIQCCSIHRSLGRHISHIKSLQKSNLTSTQISMLHALNHSGANNLWEHALLENGSKLAKRKPNSKDSIGVKAEFIRAKHQQLAFVFRPNNEDGLLCVENELGKQLHASVRTGNLDTSFRLLIQGADPNYFHDEKGTTPLHVAAKANQKEQAELLMIYGADPTFPDVNGLTPIDYAKQNINKDMFNRLVDNQYEVTDKFIYYLCLRKPDHANGVHFIIPQTGSKCNVSIVTKLQKLSNQVFEELAMDVYDEIDRREIESIWTSSAETLELSAVPFLPVDPSLSTTRNQSRQKLGRFTTPELKALVHDIIIDTQRRQLMSEKSSQAAHGLQKLRELSQVSDDDPLYDSVASDDDYAVINPKTPQQGTDRVDNKCNNKTDNMITNSFRTENTKTSPAKSTDENHNPTNHNLTSHNPINHHSTNHNPLNNNSTNNNSANYNLTNHNSANQNLISYNHQNQTADQKNEMSMTNATLEALAKKLLESNDTISDLKLEVNNLKALVEHLNQENFNLKSKLSQISIADVPKKVNGISGQHSLDSCLPTGEDNSLNQTKQPNSNVRVAKRPSSMYETREGLRTPNWQTLKSMAQKNSESSRNTIQGLSTQSLSTQVSTSNQSQSKEIIAYTEHVTKCIQELWHVIQGSGRENCVPYAGKIRYAVNNLTQALPSDNNGEVVKHILDCVHYLHVNCMGLQISHKGNDEQQMENYMQKVRKCAYEIAKDTKQLVTKYTSQ